MTPNKKMELLSLAYIRAVAAKTGYDVTRPELDIDSVDGTIVSSYGRRPRIDFQAKATYQNVARSDSIHFPLPVKNYDDLRSDTRTPRILIVLLMPRNNADWLAQTDRDL